MSEQSAFRDALSFGPVELDTFVKVFATSDAYEALVTDAFRSACEADAEHRVRALAAIVRRGLNGDDAVVSAMRLAERAVHDLENVDERLARRRRCDTTSRLVTAAAAAGAVREPSVTSGTKSDKCAFDPV